MHGKDEDRRRRELDFWRAHTLWKRREGVCLPPTPPLDLKTHEGNRDHFFANRQHTKPQINYAHRTNANRPS